MIGDIENFDIKNTQINVVALKMVDESYVHERKVFPYNVNDKEFFIAMVDVQDSATIVALKPN